LPTGLVARLARTYGTRMSQILGNARRPGDLGRCLLADLHEAELSYLVKKEWARDAQDVLWRRTRLGLVATPSAVDHLQDAVAKLIR